MPNYAVPDWVKPGCLPRKTQFGKLKGVPAFRESIEVIPKKDWPELIPKQPGIRFCVPEPEGVYNQGQVGSCACESGSQALSIVRVFCGQPWLLFNPYGIYGRVNGGVDAGSSLDDVAAFLRKYGAFPESVWPRSKGWRAEPTDEAYEAAYSYRLLESYDIGSAEEAVTALLLGMPVHYGSNGHAKCFVRVLTPEKGLYVNSWGSDWGDGGFGTERFANIWWQYGAFAYRTAVDTGRIS